MLKQRFPYQVSYHKLIAARGHVRCITADQWVVPAEHGSSHNLSWFHNHTLSQSLTLVRLPKILPSNQNFMRSMVHLSCAFFSCTSIKHIKHLDYAFVEIQWEGIPSRDHNRISCKNIRGKTWGKETVLRRTQKQKLPPWISLEQKKCKKKPIFYFRMASGKQNLDLIKQVWTEDVGAMYLRSERLDPRRSIASSSFDASSNATLFMRHSLLSPLMEEEIPALKKRRKPLN